MTRLSRRLNELPSYAVNELAAKKRELRAAGRDVIDLGAGDARVPPPELAVQALTEALADPQMSRYAFQSGLTEYREAVARYMKRRFGVTVDPFLEVLPLIGSKDGLAHLPLAVLNPGDTCILPAPGYPAYVGGGTLAGAELEVQRLRARDAFLLELENVPTDRLARAGLVYLNYPNNPTTAVAPLDYLERTVRVCRRHGIVLAYDNPYCELTYEGYLAPSVLQIAGAREVALEFHSFSKSFCMTGWRLGWAVGSADLIAALSKVKSYVDTGPFLAVQRAGAAVLSQAERLAQSTRRLFRERRDAAVRAFTEAGFQLEAPRATMYLWVALPLGVSATNVARDVLEREAIMVMPGSAFGDTSDQYFRVALTEEANRLADAASRIARVLLEVETASAKA